MPAEITDDYAERTRLMIVAGRVPDARDPGQRRRLARDPRRHRRPRRVSRDGSDRRRPARPRHDRRVRRHAARPDRPYPQETTGTLRDQLRLVARVADFRWLLITLMLQALAIGSMLAGIDYLARYVLRDPGAATIGFVCVVGPALLVSPLWLAFGQRFGKRTGFLAASGVLGLRCVWRCRPRSMCRRGACTSRPASSGSGSRVHRCSRSRCCPTLPRSTPRAAAYVGPVSSRASGRPAKRSGWHSVLGCTRWCSPLAGMCRRPTVTAVQPGSAVTAIVARNVGGACRTDRPELLLVDGATG